MSNQPDYLYYWRKDTRDYRVSKNERCCFFLDFLSQLGIRSATPEQITDDLIDEWIKRLLGEE